MEPIDAAHDAFKSLVLEVADYMDSVETEADVRLKVINRVLVEVLLWPYDSISTEPHRQWPMSLHCSSSKHTQRSSRTSGAGKSGTAPRPSSSSTS
jgi:hypothetical protein